MFIRTIAAFIVSLLLLAPAWADEPIVKSTLIAEQASIAAGQNFRVGVALEPKEGWHTYWENPGDAGMPTTLEWTLPPGFSAEPIDWPVPERLAEGPLVTYSYVGNVFLPVTITAPDTLDAKTVPIDVKASWLVCKDICVPESATLHLELPVMILGESHLSTSTANELFAQHDKMRPQSLESNQSLGYMTTDKTLTISLQKLAVQDIKSALFFPRQENIIVYASEQKLDISDATNPRLTLDITQPPTSPMSGLLVITTANDEKKYYDVALTQVEVPAPVKAAPVAAEATPSFLDLIPVLLAAMLGGLILNLMPCVLPVLSLKALAIAKKSGHEHKVVIKMGVAYTLGILLSFAVIAGVLIGLRQGGEAIGWGYQMQSPAFVGFLIYLLFLVGLNLSGLFELPVLLGNVGGVANESSARGSFFTGVLATAVATPCTAPFMASAVGLALTLPAVQSLLIFESLGFGLALPFLLVSLFPWLLRFLPRPGAWMETFKQLLAFPMYASVIWLLWVLTLQTGAGGMAVALLGMLAIIIVIWIKRLFADGHYRGVALLAYALILGLSLPALSRMEIMSPMVANMERMGEKMGFDTVEFSKEKLAELRASHKPVFIDATAAWCITCQVNGRVAIRTTRTMEAFKQYGVTLMIADWTRRNDDITEFLSGFGYKGVPLYVFYPASGEPTVLPQLLTEDIVINAIKGE